MSDARQTAPSSRLGLPGRILFLVVLVQLLAAVALLQKAIDDRFGEYRATEEILYVESGEALKKVLLGFESLAADLYWLRTVQYFGGQRLYSTDKRFELLEPLLNITTTLDPHLRVAYTYGATFLSEPWPTGAGEPLKGLALIDKGIENNPEHWRFYLDKGFIYFWVLEDYKKAAEIFLQGSKLPGAPYWMVATAGRTLTRGGDRDTAKELWRILYDTAENEQMRHNALTHLQQLDALDQAEALTALAGKFKEHQGYFPESWQEMITAGYLRGVPADPLGVPYVLNPRDERAEVSEDSFLAALPTR
ncbi:MAG TPA: hypothetical protein VJB88_01675 [Vicinamibacteria bacterium]|nr:hypothetical protein [Vicinamibacteria bacterium]